MRRLLGAAATRTCRTSSSTLGQAGTDSLLQDCRFPAILYATTSTAVNTTTLEFSKQATAGVGQPSKGTPGSTAIPMAVRSCGGSAAFSTSAASASSG